MQLHTGATVFGRSPRVFFPALAGALAIALVLLLTPHASGAGAADGLHLTWNDCPLGPSSSQNRNFDCASETGRSDLFLAFTVGAPVDSVLGLEAVVDLQAAGLGLPDWWSFQAGACRADVLLASDVFGATNCLDVWQGQTSGGVVDYVPGMPRGGGNQARLRMALGVPVPQARFLDNAGMYYAFRVVIPHVATAGCSGCATPVCLVFNTLRIRRPPRPEGAPDGDVLLQTPGSSGNWSTWQTGLGADCLAVPARNRTWGAVKALYR